MPDRTRPASGHPIFEEAARQLVELGWYPDTWGRVRVRVHRDSSTAPYRVIVEGAEAQRATYDRDGDRTAAACADSVRAMFEGQGHTLRSEREPIRQPPPGTKERLT